MYICNLIKILDASSMKWKQDHERIKHNYSTWAKSKFPSWASNDESAVKDLLLIKRFRFDGGWSTSLGNWEKFDFLEQIWFSLS